MQVKVLVRYCGHLFFMQRISLKSILWILSLKSMIQVKLLALYELLTLIVMLKRVVGILMVHEVIILAFTIRYKNIYLPVLLKELFREDNRVLTWSQFLYQRILAKMSWLLKRFSLVTFGSSTTSTWTSIVWFLKGWYGWLADHFIF